MSLQKTTQSYKKLQKLLNKILAVLNKFSIYNQGKPVKFFRNSEKKRREANVPAYRNERILTCSHTKYSCIPQPRGQKTRPPDFCGCHEISAIVLLPASIHR